MKKVLLTAIILLAGITPYTLAAVINVPGSYPTIQSGINAASQNDTVLVDTGIYNESVTDNGIDNISLIGNTGAIINSTGLYSVHLVAVDGWLIKGFEIVNGINDGIYLEYCRYTTVRNNHIHHCNYGGGIHLNYCFDALIDHNVCANNGNILLCHGIWIYSSMNSRIVNNTVASNNGVGIFFCYEGQGSIVKNNISIDNELVGISFYNGAIPDSNAVGYNDSWDNGLINYWGCLPGPGSLSLDPLFVGGFPHDYHLTASSPCIDAGNPASPPDPDWTIADMGAFYFHQPPSIEIDIFPDNTPVIVPRGGDFTFTGVLRNNTGSGQFIDVWIMIDVPGIGILGPLRRYNHIPLGPLYEITIPGITQHVPGNAPLGIYEYIAYCGDYPSEIIDDASFEFTVTASPGENGGSWELDGWFHSDTHVIPDEPVLVGNYPNPFNTATTIRYSLPEQSNISLDIYNLSGQHLSNLVRCRKEAGNYTVIWSARRYPSGIYFIKLKTGDLVFTRRITLLK